MDCERPYDLTETAECDIRGIVAYIADELGSPKAAADFTAKLRHAIENIVLFPESSPLLSNPFLPDFGIRKRPMGNYIVYYLLNERVVDERIGRITVLRVLYAGRDQSRALQDM